jgi:queuine tRNA-ribosyltransferase
MLSHTITHKDPKSLARRGELKLFHGTVQTPAFMPVGTVGAVKTLLPNEVKDLGAEIILGNTYHLYLRPGDKEIAAYGGIQAWNHWDGPVLTDSGGFQVFSLGGKERVKANDTHGQELTTQTPADQPLRSTKQPYDADEAEAGLVKMTEEGAHFSSHLDGSKHLFTPENVVDTQINIGSDIMMVLDECTEFPASYDRARSSMERTHRWAKRATDHFDELKKAKPEIGERHNLFGIAQGSTYQDLREESAKYISSLPFDGIAVGGVSVGEGKDHMYQVMEWTGPLLPEDKPHYLMGIGEPEDITRAVAHGYDMFDCVLPTRLGRYGVIWRAYYDADGNYEKFEKWDMRANRFRNAKEVIDDRCGCPSCAGGYSRGFIDHMLREREVVGIRLTTMHNLWTILNLMSTIRRSLEKGTFTEEFRPFI